MILEVFVSILSVLVMKNSVLILGHSFIVRLRRFVHSAEHSKVNLNLNLSERVIYRGYTPFLMRSNKYSYQTKTRLRSYRVKTKQKMEVKEASASRDLRVVPEITFGFVENFITEGRRRKRNI